MATIKIVNAAGKERVIDLSMEQHIQVNPGEQVELQNLPIQPNALFKSNSDLLVLLPDGSVIVLADFFAPSGDGSTASSVQVADQTFYPADFESTLSLPNIDGANTQSTANETDSFSIVTSDTTSPPATGAQIPTAPAPVNEDNNNQIISDMMMHSSSTTIIPTTPIPPTPSVPPPAPPSLTAQSDSITIDERVTTQVSGNILANDVYTGGTFYPYIHSFNNQTLLSGASSVLGNYGSFIVNPDGSYVYQLDVNNPVILALIPGQQLTEVIPYEAASDSGLLSSASLTITIIGRNDGPIVQNENLITTEDAPAALTGNVLTNDSDPDGGVLSVAAVNGNVSSIGATITATYGSITIGNDGSYSYTVLPSAQSLGQGQSGIDSFVYQVSDGQGGFTNGTINITVLGLDDGISLVPDVNVTSEDSPITPITGNVLSNDTIIDAEDNHVVAVNGNNADVGISVIGTYGSVVINDDGSYSYVLNNALPAVQALAQGQVVTDVFSYTVNDIGGGSSQTVNLTIIIFGTNDTPVAIADVATVQEDVIVTASGNVLANDTDVDSGASLTAIGVSFGTTAGTISSAVAGNYGSVIINNDGSYTYSLNNAAVQTLAQGQSVLDSFNYTVSDEFGATSIALLTITINGTNDAPVAVVDNTAVQEDTIVTASGNVLANDTDVDNGAHLSAVGVGVGTVAGTLGATVNGSYGSFTLDASGNYSYSLNNAVLQTLAQGQSVLDSFNYTISDEYGVTSTSSLVVTINGTNDTPVAIA
ncbi:MAG: VCBS domain-containing protein, partial [Gammaproteobacteria bacterium]